MISRVLLSIVILLTLAPVCLPQELGPRHYESEGGFSFHLPLGWSARAVRERKYKVILGPPAKGFAPNINASVESFSGSLDDYADTNLRILSRQFERAGLKSYKVLSRSYFTTLSGQRGLRVIIQSELYGKLFRQTFYSFNLRVGKKLLFTCSAPADGGEAYDGVFEKSMKTLELVAKAR